MSQILAATDTSSPIYIIVVPMIVAVIAALGAYFSARTGNKKTQDDLHEVHVLVNSQLNTVLARVDQLEHLLAANEIYVPPVEDLTQVRMKKLEELLEQHEIPLPIITPPKLPKKPPPPLE